jgi:hypothetical protein
MKEIYISTDIEADGPIPCPHSMLSIGSAAYTTHKVLVSTFSANLETLPTRNRIQRPPNGGQSSPRHGPPVAKIWSLPRAR